MDSAVGEGGGRVNVVIEVRGAQEAARALEALMDALPGACAAGLGEGLAGMLDGARRLCPVETGDLKTSLSARSEAVAGGAEGAVSAGAAHAVYVELGTSRMAARPFLLPACQAERGALLAAVARAVRGVIAG